LEKPKEAGKVSVKHRLWLNAIIIVLLMMVPLLIKRTDLITWFTYTLLYITLAQSWNLIGGYTGQQNLGHAAFFGIGALCTRFLWLSGLPLPLAVVAGALAATIFAVIIGFPAFRLKGVYFIIGTLVLAEILRIIFDTVLPHASVLPSKLLNSYSLVPRYYLSLLMAIVTVTVVYWISRSRLGLGLMSIREDEDAAEAAGVNTLRYKLTAFVISTFLAAMGGGVYAYFAAAALPGQMFSAVWTFDAVIIVFVGGVGTIIGPIIGSVFFVLLQQLLSLYLPGGTHVLVFGILFIVVVLYLPGGLIGLLARLRQGKPQKESDQIAA